MDDTKRGMRGIPVLIEHDEWIDPSDGKVKRREKIELDAPVKPSTSWLIALALTSSALLLSLLGLLGRLPL